MNKPRAGARILVAAWSLLLGPALVPASAGEPASAPIRASLARLVQSDQPLRLQQESAPASGRSFFRTRRGVAALVATAVVTGVVVYSAKHGRVKSAIR